MLQMKLLFVVKRERRLKIVSIIYINQSNHASDVLTLYLQNILDDEDLDEEDLDLLEENTGIKHNRLAGVSI